MVMTTLMGLGVGAAMSAGITAAQGGSVGDILKRAGVSAITGAATAGVGSAVGGSVVGAMGSGLSKVGGALAQNSGSLLSKVGTGLTNAGSKMISFGADHGIKAATATIKGANAAIGSTTGEAANISTTTVGAQTVDTTASSANVANTITTASAETPVTQAHGSTGVGQLMNADGTTSDLSFKMPKNFDPKIGTTKNIAPFGYKQTGYKGLLPDVGNGTPRPTFVQTGAGKAAGAAKLAVGQYGVQGVLSLVSGIQAAKQAKAASQVQTQSLLFQRQTYEEAKAKEESTKAQLKSDAWNAYSSASLFGENLYGSDSNNTLLTSYNTNGTGNQGVFSLLSTGVTTRKTEDII